MRLPVNTVTVLYQGWRFQVDWEKTKQFQGGFRTKIPRFPEELIIFFEKLGIDLARPVTGEANSCCYILFGTAESEDGLELDFYGPEQYVSVVIHPYPKGWKENDLNIQESCVLLEVFGA